MVQFCNYPIKEELNQDLKIAVNGMEVQAVNTRVSAMPFNRYWPGQQRPLNQTEMASYLYVATDETPLCVTVTPARTFETVTVRPLSAGIKPSVAEGSIQFTVQTHGYYTVELDGPHNALHLFVRPIPEFDLPEDKASLRYFGPGVHHIGHTELRSNETVYIHRDAVVYGSFYTVNAKNIKIYGEGVLDGSHYERKTEDFLLAYDYSRVPDESWEKQQMKELVDGNQDCFTDISQYQMGSGTFIYRDRAQFDKLMGIMQPVKTGLNFYASENIEIKGVIFRNCAGLSITQAGCKNVHYDGVKLIGMWRYNSDGIDFYNCQNCSVRNSFLRTFDDTVCVKGQIGWDTGCSSDILVEKCVLWNDWGHTLDIGVDTVAPEIYNITFRDCDCIHTTGATIDIGNGDRALIHDVLVENLRVEYSQYDLAPVYQNSDEMVFVPEKRTPRLVDMFLYCGVWSIDRMYGKISNVTFKDIAVFSDEETFPSNISIKGHNQEHDIQNVVFQNITHNGKVLASAEALNMETNEFAGVTVL